MNRLYFGDNLAWLRDRREFPDASVDLVYLDPPFNSNADYNVLFREPSGQVSQAQFHAFTDTWSWADAADTYHAFTDTCPNVAVVELMEALHSFLKHSPMMAYLAMMAPRLVELHRVLKPTGSLYLHCDPTASHYLRMLMDGIFGAENFRNEIVWQRTTAKTLMTRRLPSNHDLLLAYQRTDQAFWNPGAIFRPYDPDALDEKTEKKYCFRDPDGRRYTLGDLTNPNRNRPNLTYEFLGHHKVWRWAKERMQGKIIVHSREPGNRARYLINDARGQLRPYAEAGVPSVAVLYDNIIVDGTRAYPSSPWSFSPLSSTDIDVALYGLWQANVRLHPGGRAQSLGDTRSRWKLMRDRQVISAVLVVYEHPEKDDLFVIVYHNFWARVPLPRDVFNGENDRHFAKVSDPDLRPDNWVRV